MKRFFFTPLPLRTLLFCLVLMTCAFADGQNRLALSASTPYSGETNGIISNVPLNEINVHAFRHFMRNFPQVSGESWLKMEKGYIVSFTQNSQRSQVHYNLKGSFQYSITYYTDAAIPQEIVAQIKKNYSNYAIGVVTELKDGAKTTWTVKIENSSSVKTISFCDGKMELVEDLVNAG